MINNNEKIGHFEWIVSYDGIKHYLLQPYLKQSDLGVGSTVLIIGCGTSTLAESIAEDFSPSQVIAIDNDAGCIDHMKKMKSSQVIYECYDLVEPSRSTLLGDERFHLIVDKGTFDAILVEGSVVSLLEEVSRMLRISGKYVLFTINKQAFIERLFAIPTLHFRLLHAEKLSADHEENVFIFEKIQMKSCFTSELAEHERLILHQAFHVECSLLSQEFLRNLEREYKQRMNGLEDKGLDAIDAYNIMFAERKDLEYSFEMFVEDVKIFFEDKKYFKLDDLIAFIKLVE